MTGLVNGQAYTFTVIATNAVGSSAASAPSAAVVPTGAPGAPRSPVASPRRAAAVVSWRAPTSSGGLAITRYVVTARPGGRQCATMAPARTCTVTGLVNRRAYRFSVTALNATGASSASALSASITAGTATTPQALKASFPAARTATVSWAAPAHLGSGAVRSYRVRWSSNGGSSWTSWTTVGLLRYTTRGGLVRGHRYLVQVTAVNDSGAGQIALRSFVR